MKKNAIVTGGAGFIGSHVCEEFLSAGYDVYVLDDLSSGSIDNLPVGVKFKRASITNNLLVNSYIRELKPEVVCHQAAQPSLLRSHKEPELDANTNIMGALAIIEAIKKYSPETKLIFASTMAVFPNNMTMMNEITKPNPERPYGISKYAAEMYIQHSGVDCVILRYGNVYGPRQVPVGENQLVARLFSHIYKGTDFSIFGDGNKARDMVYVKDIAKANLKAIDAPHRIYHLGTGTITTVNDIVAYICKISGYDLDKIVHTKPIDEPGKIHIQSVHGWDWVAETALKDGLEKTMSWWRVQ